MIRWISFQLILREKQERDKNLEKKRKISRKREKSPEKEKNLRKKEKFFRRDFFPEKILFFTFCPLLMLFLLF